MLSNSEAQLRDELKAIALAGVPAEFRRARFTERFPESDVVKQIGKREILRQSWGVAFTGKRSAEAAFTFTAGLVRAQLWSRVLYPTELRDLLKSRSLDETLDEVEVMVVPYISDQPFDKESQGDILETMRRYLHRGRKIVLAFDVPPPTSSFGQPVAAFLRSHFFVSEVN